MNEKLKEILSMSLYLLGVLIISFLIIRFVGQRTRVNGSSMMNTLYDGDNLILNKISYNFHDPERFDVVVFPFRDKSGKNYIKRVIGLPGETVQIDESGQILKVTFPTISFRNTFPTPNLESSDLLRLSPKTKY